MEAPSASSPVPARLYYLDWLRVLAILMVFLFHAFHVFDFADWQIKNGEQSEIITIILTLLFLWGMPFFFLIAGAAAWFALQRRSPRQYISERFERLVIPFIAGVILFSPLQYYLMWMNHVQLLTFTGSFGYFMQLSLPPFKLLDLAYPGWSPAWLGIGFHLWFVGFLFFFALITLPLFRWLKGERGGRALAWLGRLCDRRGGVLLLVVPLVIVQFLLRPFFRLEHDWADFMYLMAFFAVGYLVFADERITRAVRRDGWILAGVGTAVIAGLLAMYALDVPVIVWGDDPSVPQYYLILALTTTVALCYSLTILSIGMRFLNFTNRALQYGQEAALPFFVLHQPVIIAIAFFVVQWRTGIEVKLPVVVIGSFVVALGLYELVVRRVRPLQMIFGMKTGRLEKAPGPVRAST